MLLWGTTSYEMSSAMARGVEERELVGKCQLQYNADDVLESPLLPGFSCLLSQVFDEVLRES
jgi:hypothetical protein